MKGLLILLLGLLAQPLQATCSADYYGDYEVYDYDSMDQVRNFCNQHARNFGIIRVGKTSEPIPLEHFGQMETFVEKDGLSLQDANFEDYCFYVQRRTGGGWGGSSYKYDARFYYQLGTITGRGQWDVFRGFEEYAWYNVYQGWDFQVRLHFPSRCDDY